MVRSDETDLTSVQAGKGVIRRDGGADRQIYCLAAIVLFVAVFAIVAVVLAALALGRPNTPIINTIELPDIVSGTTGGRESEYAPDKIWVFAIGHDGTNLEYIHDLTGTVRGFHVDIVEAVCNLANKNCRLMWDIYENCYMSKAGARPRPGEGLVARWYDGCTGWFATYERISSVSFTKPFRQPLDGIFYVKRGNPQNFDSSDITGKKIGFVDGDASNEFCLLREGIPGSDLPAANIVHYSTKQDVIDGVNNLEVDAVFTNVQLFDLQTDLDVVAGNPITTCMLDGAGMMVRKDSRVPDWWNPAFDQLKQTSAYRNICDNILTHGFSSHTVDCVP